MLVNPDQIECLVLEGEDINFEKMLNERENDFEGGKIQEGVIVSIGNEYAMIAVSGAKQEGRLPIAEICDEGGNTLFKVGDKIEVYVIINNERLNVSRKKVLKIKKIEEKINQIKDNFEGLVLDCKISKKNKGGYIAECDDVEVFLPRKESAGIRDDKKGRTYKMRVIDVKPQEQTIIVSRKQFLENADKDREEILRKLLAEESKIHSAIVKQITSYGMFVEVMGVEGLVHYTEISHRGPINPATVCKIGDSVDVKVLTFDPNKKRVSFTIKGTMQDPWNEIKNQLDVGDTIRVVVSKIEDYGAFVDLGNGTEGFLHVSEISWNKQIRNPRELLKVGEALDVEVIEIDGQNKRLRVSLKRLSPKPFTQFVATHKVGDVVKGKVVKIMDFGAFIRLGDVDGLLHNEDVSWEKGSKANEKVKLNDEVEVKITKIDEENEKISLSLRALQSSPIEDFVQKNGLDTIVRGKIKDIRDFGIFVELAEGVEALIRDEDLYPLKKEELSVGTEIEGVIAYIDRNNGKMRISVRRLERIREREQLNSYNSTDTKMTLGDLIKQRS
ncbi:S1 RNA-binding domain-containing protein [Helicobacter cholecystus]|uniref:S1 RNA-binding domain-containing protein n=1 Tax=Helicobacter cholecystus TaxID=45498 RepID=UPI002738FA67|nr:S1 RNA-binding domain-containing protein [Helicobacter cholecystus]